MNYLIGIDVGTSATKTVLLMEKGRLLLLPLRNME